MNGRLFAQIKKEWPQVAVEMIFRFHLRPTEKAHGEIGRQWRAVHFCIQCNDPSLRSARRFPFCFSTRAQDSKQENR